jgi:osmotically-inducible protein OsmY
MLFLVPQDVKNKQEKNSMKLKYTKPLIAASAASLLLFSVPVFAYTANPVAEKETNQMRSGTEAGMRMTTDAGIEKEAKGSYVFRTYLKDGDKINVQSKDGAVTLSGTVSEEGHKALAEETVRNIDGVKSVDNKLEYKGESSVEMSDTWLTTKVKTALLFRTSVSGFKTEVNTVNGIVTLTGEATSQAQKDLTGEYAKDIEGVKSVKNEMTVTKDEKSAQMATGNSDVIAVSNVSGQPQQRTVKQETMPVSTGDKGRSDAARTAGEKIDDASITAMVKTSLLYHRSTGGLKTSVTTRDGVVTLEGEAKNSAEKELATRYTKDVHGVVSVNNNMSVK